MTKITVLGIGVRAVQSQELRTRHLNPMARILRAKRQDRKRLNRPMHKRILYVV